MIETQLVQPGGLGWELQPVNGLQAAQTPPIPLPLPPLGHAFPLLPAEVAWLFATRPIFLYPELLPVCSLEQRRDQRSIYTAGENGSAETHTHTIYINIAVCAAATEHWLL